MSKSTVQSGARHIARERGDLGVPEVSRVRQDNSLSVRVSSTVKKRINKVVDLRRRVYTREKNKGLPVTDFLTPIKGIDIPLEISDKSFNDKYFTSMIAYGSCLVKI